MNKFVLSLLIALMAIEVVNAQQISVVKEGSTSLYRTLQEAVENAEYGSVIYLPGGGFSIADSVKITKRLTIIGIGHFSNNENVDGITNISGNLFFNEGSSGSAVMACYITGNVNIGEGGSAVSDVMIKYCNLNSIHVNNTTCKETVVSQNFIRNMSTFGNSNANLSNNIMHSIWEVDGGSISYNILLNYGSRWSGGWQDNYCINVNNSIITNNIIIPYASDGGSNWGQSMYSGSNNSINNNLSKKNFGDNSINIGSVSWSDLFVNYNGGAISPTSDFHFKEAYQQYENQVGIYAGVGFKDSQLAPVPYIISKRVDDQTDASGNLNIRIRVKAGE